MQGKRGNTPTAAELPLTAIGVVRSVYVKPAQAPRQPGVDDRRDQAVIELAAGFNFEQALEDLAGFERIWVVAWFDRVAGWKPKVLPPRGTAKRGLFATRSPHRPNPIALSVARLVKIDGRRLTIAETDLLDGTPVLDLKPYIPASDSFPDSRAGWLEDLPPVNQVRWSKSARAAADFLREQGVDLIGPAERILALGTDSHPYRRVTALARGRRELAIESWRVQFRVQATVVTITAVGSGYSAAAIARNSDEKGQPLHQAAAHRAWLAKTRQGAGAVRL